VRVTEYYFPNYPYNDLRQDPFLLEKSNAYTIKLAESSTSSICRQFTVYAIKDGIIRYIDCYSGEAVEKKIGAGGDFPVNVSFNLCALDFPSPEFDGGAEGSIISNTYNWYKLTVGAADQTEFWYYPPVPAGGYCGFDGLSPTILPPPSGYTDWAEYCALNPTNGCCNPNPPYTQSPLMKRYWVVDGSTFGGVRIIPSLNPPVYESGDGGYSIELVGSSWIWFLCSVST